MASDQKRLNEVFRHIERIKAGDYPAIVGRDNDYRIVERPWHLLAEQSKLAVLLDAVDWSGITNRDQAHILLSEIDPGKIADAQRNWLIDMAHAKATLSDILRGHSGLPEREQQGRENDWGREM